MPAHPRIPPPPPDHMPRNLTKWNNRPSHATASVYTGQQLKAADPERYQAIVRAAKEGMATTSIAKVFLTNAETVAAILRHENVQPMSYQSLIQKASRAAHISTEQLIEAMEGKKLAVDKLPVVAGIMIDKVIATASQLNNDSAMQKIQITPNQLGDLIKQCQTKPEKQQVIDAVVVDNESPQS